MDKFDPRKNPLGHLVFDAPEVLIGLASAALGGSKVASYIYKKQNNSIFSKRNSTVLGLLSSLVFGYLGFALTKKIKNLQ